MAATTTTMHVHSLAPNFTTSSTKVRTTSWNLSAHIFGINLFRRLLLFYLQVAGSFCCCFCAIVAAVFVFAVSRVLFLLCHATQPPASALAAASTNPRSRTDLRQQTITIATTISVSMSTKNLLPRLPSKLPSVCHFCCAYGTQVSRDPRLFVSLKFS